MQTKNSPYFLHKNIAPSILDETNAILVEARHVFPPYLCAVKSSKIKNLCKSQVFFPYVKAGTPFHPTPEAF
jgi:hypothetical protein